MEKLKGNAELWEAKFNITEISLVEYREAARTLARANEELTTQQYRTEKDTQDIISFLKKTDQEKKEMVCVQLLSDVCILFNCHMRLIFTVIASYTQQCKNMDVA